MKEPAWKSLARLFAVITALLVAHVQVTAGLTQRCYVCVPNAGGSVADVQAMFPGEKSALPKCDDFNTVDSRFERECPSTHTGCLTQTNGSQVTRTCGDLPVNDCKYANNIKYCYCSGNLCNGESVSPDGGHPDATDDEDLAQEGSGAGGDRHGNRDTHRHRTSPPTTLRSIVPITTSATTTSHAKSDAASRTDTVMTATTVVLCLALGGRL